MKRSSAGRKSLLGRRSGLVMKANSICSDVDSAAKKDKKSMLLKPGFAMRRASSNDRLSGIPSVSKPSTSGMSEMRQRSKSQANLSFMTPKTPRNLSHNLQMMVGSRPSRSHVTSMDSNRMSSIGAGMRSTRKERRPINDKEFQSQSLKRIQDYFLMQPNCRELLDNSMTIRPISIKKFTNMVEFLLLKINPDLPPLTKENYVEEIIKNMKVLNYGGKLEKSWLITLAAQHSWPSVVGLIVWLIDLVRLSELVAGDMNIFFPDSLGVPSIDDDEETEDYEDDDIINDNRMLTVPYLSSIYVSSLERDPEFEAKKEIKSDQLMSRIMDKMNLSDEANAAMEVELNELKKVWNDPEFFAKEAELQNKKSQLEKITTDIENMIDYIDKTRTFIMTREQDKDFLLHEIEVLKKKHDDCKMRVACLAEECDTLKQAKQDSDKMQKERQDLEASIDFHEKGIDQLKKSIYSLDIKLLKIKKKIEEPLVPFNQLIAENVKDEPLLKLCAIGNIMQERSRNPNFTEDIKSKLIRIRDDWQHKVHALALELKEVEETKATREEHRERLLECVEKSQKQLEALKQQIRSFLEHKEKESAKYKAEIAELSENIQKTVESMPVIDEEEKNKKIELDIMQKEDIEGLIVAARYSFEKSRDIYKNFAKEAEKSVQSALKEVEDYLIELECH